MMDQRASNDLDEYQNVQRRTNAMMRVRQAAWESYCHVTQYEYDGCEQHCQKLQPYVQSERRSRVPVIETSYHDRSRDNGEEGYGRENAVRLNYRTVSGKIAEPVGHAYMSCQ